ncbi:hypothetical protein NL676_001055 [Syzygium grande]|nr:hypothetical protein NL676_001055 [Syzygium grande]
MSFICGTYFTAYPKVCYFGIFTARIGNHGHFEGPAVVWSANRNKTGMNLTDTGNLVLFNKNNATVWQSFDHPTDSLLLGQKLKVGQKLTPSTSALNWNEHGFLSLPLTTVGLFAQIGTDPPQVYFPFWINFPNTSDDSNYIEFIEGGLASVMNSARNRAVFPIFDSSVRCVKFESDGHLRSYQLDGKRGEPGDLLTPFLGDCAYPTVCNKYGICNSNG